MRCRLARPTDGQWNIAAAVLTTFVVVAIGLTLPSRGYFLRVATLIVMFGGMACAWNIISGYANQISLGHAAFFGFGAYTSTLLFIHFGISPWVGMVAAVAAGAILSVVIGIPTFRLRGHYYALATFAAAELLLALALYLRDLTKGAVGLSMPVVANPTFWSFQFVGNRVYFFIAVVLLAITMAVSFWVEHSALGFRLMAIRGSHEAAEVVGVDTTRCKLQANILSGALTAMFGTFYAQFQFFIDPSAVFGFWSISVQIAIIAILGGVGTVWGPLLGACVLVSLDEWSHTVFTGNLASLSRLFYAIILILLIVYQPGGLLPLVQKGYRRAVRRVAHGPRTVAQDRASGG